MKYVDEFRDHALAGKLLAEIRVAVTRPWVIMEICGGQTHAIVRNGLDRLLPPEIELAHGPGCPVCVTPLELIDRAHALAQRPEVIFCSFGDMLRVPGSSGDLFQVKAQGGDVRIVYSPLDCLKIAKANPDRKVVFFAIGFETTAPANAMSVWQARAQGISNYSILVSHVTVPPAMSAILESETNRVQAFLGAGHVCAVMGWQEYEPLAERYGVPIVVTGFEPVDLLEGILAAVRQLEAGRHAVENRYGRAVSREGNPQARRMIAEVFEPCDRAWRGIGVIPGSGYALREDFAAFDAERVFDLSHITSAEPPQCISGLVLQGARRPPDCPAFGTACTPETPLGATMVSGEGACAAYYTYRRQL
jgi:hydrogenase expression/formation protein HypD